MTHPEHANFELRFDVMLIAPRRLPRHLIGGIRRQHLDLQAFKFTQTA